MRTAGITEEGEDSQAGMDNAFKWITRWGLALALILIVLWPLLALPAKDFSKGYFTFWVIISMTWGFIATVIAVVLPVRTRIPAPTCTFTTAAAGDPCASGSPAAQQSSFPKSLCGHTHQAVHTMRGFW